MPSIYQLKPAFQNLLRPFVRRLYGLGITANQVTIIAMLISVAVATYVFLSLQNTQQHYLSLIMIPLWMLVRMAFNAIDGMLAREFDQQSGLGAYLNELCDIVSDTVLYACILNIIFINIPLLCAVIFLSILSEYAGVMAPLIGQARRYDGPMGKSDRAFWFSLLTIWLILATYLPNIFSEKLIVLITNTILALIGLFLMMTIYNRICNAIKSATL